MAAFKALPIGLHKFSCNHQTRFKRTGKITCEANQAEEKGSKTSSKINTLYTLHGRYVPSSH